MDEFLTDSENACVEGRWSEREKEKRYIREGERDD